MQAIIDQLQQQLARINNELEPAEYSILEACLFIVGTEDGIFTVKANEHNIATTEFGNANPTRFSPRQADELVKNYTPSNGHGPLKLVKMSRTEFIRIRKADIEYALRVLQGVPQQSQ